MIQPKINYLSSYLTNDPNCEYAKFERIITTAYEAHFPKNRVKFNKHKHQLHDWIASGILKPTDFRDNLCRRLTRFSGILISNIIIYHILLVLISYQINRNHQSIW